MPELKPVAEFICFAFAVSTAAMSVTAAERASEFPVSQEQMRALGIELIEIQTGPNSGGATFPAVVVLPPQGQRAVSAPLAGLVSQVLVEENAAVSKGTPVMVLASPELAQLQLALVQATNRARLAARSLARERALLHDGIIPARRVQEAEAAAGDSQAGLAQARAALQLAGIDDGEIDALTKGGRMHNELIVTADMAGVVVEIASTAGQRVAAADLLLRIAAVDRLWIDVQVPSMQAAQWPRGTKLVVSGGSEARVLSASVVAAGSQLVTLRAELIGHNANLRPGEFVQAELPVAADAWEIPLSALARHNNQAYVFVRAGEHFIATPVMLLSNSGQRAKVRGDLQPGQKIAAASVISLKAAWLGLGGMEDE